MKSFLKLLKWIHAHLVISIPLAMLAGFGCGFLGWNSTLQMGIMPFTFLMVYPMMTALNIRTLFEKTHFQTQLLTQILNFAIIPFLAMGLGYLFFKNNSEMRLGLLLAGLLPTSGMTISWTGLAKGNLAAAIKMTLIGLILGSLLSPFYIKNLMGTSIEMDIKSMFLQMMMIVFIPMGIGYITRSALLKKYGQQHFQHAILPHLSSFSTLGVVGVVFIAIALKAQFIVSHPFLFFYILIPLVILYALNYALATFLGNLFLSRGHAIAMVYGSVMRNLSIALAISMNVFGSQGSSVALVIAAAYVVQVQSAAWYVKFTDYFFPHPVPTSSNLQEIAASPCLEEIRSEAAHEKIEMDRMIR